MVRLGWWSSRWSKKAAALSVMVTLAPYMILADVRFTTPEPGISLMAGSAIDIRWVDSGTAPSLSDLTTYQLILCVGGNAPGTYIDLITVIPSGTFSSGSVAQAIVRPDLAGNAQNGFFLKMISKSVQGGTITNYSQRFTITGMSGNFPANVAAALASVSGLAGPERVNALADGQTNTENTQQIEMLGIPFAQQTGLTRYAPMQALPPTRISAKRKTPLYPTSSVVLAKSKLPTPTPVQTITMSRTYSFKMIENTLAPAPGPHSDLSRFLNRWKD